MGSVTIIIRAILPFLSLVSFIPQYRLIWSKRDCSGISLSYVLFNLIAFTEQFALGLHFVLESFAGGDSVIHIKPTVGDWLNLCQHTLVWICYLVFFILCLSCQPERPGQKYTVSAIYVSFLLISVAPVIFELSYITEQDIRWVMAFFSHYHTIYINPIVTIICFASLFLQARETLSRPSPGTLSITGLAIQTVIFAVVALYWPWRRTPSREHLELPPLRRFITWYQLDGWATVDNAVFAFVQAVLLWIAVRRRSGIQAVTTDETTPLLQD